MSDHYCCKSCGQRYDLCTCGPRLAPSRPSKAKPKSLWPMTVTLKNEKDFWVLCQRISAELIKELSKGA